MTKPYSFDWTPNGLGSYTVKAVAYKTGGASITSSEATITVVASDKSDLTDDVYRLRNKATGRFLTDAGASATAVTKWSVKDASSIPRQPLSRPAKKMTKPKTTAKTKPAGL